MHPHRLRAPSSDGALLADPPFDRAGAAMAENGERLRRWDHDFQGRRADRLRAMARAQVVALARRHHEIYGLDWPEQTPAQPDRLVMTGHQPELFHPGVWVKNFAVAGLAASQGAVGLNLIVDNDIPKGPSIRVPHRDGANLRVSPVAFDVWAGEVPYEDQAVGDEALFATFPDRVRATLGGLVAGPLIDSFWPRVLRRKGETDRVGLRFALARREVERPSGASASSRSRSGWSASPRRSSGSSAMSWRSCLDSRPPTTPRSPATDRPTGSGASITRSPPSAVRANGSRPRSGAWRADAPRRRPLMVRMLAKSMELRIGGEDAPFLDIPLAPDRDACCAVEELQGLPGLGIRLRTRALTTTLFSRYLLGDLFVHGIGGAKYDELGDELAREFFGIEPPTFLTLSLTRWLGLEDDPATPDRLRERRARRSATSTGTPIATSPSPGPPRPGPAVEAKWVAIEGEIVTRRQRLDRLRAIRDANEALAPWTEDARSALLAERGPAPRRHQAQRDRPVPRIRLPAPRRGPPCDR